MFLIIKHINITFILLILFIFCLLNRKTEGFRELKKFKVPLTWQNLNNDELKTVSNELKESIERKLKVDAEEMKIILNYKNVDYKRSKIMKIKDRKVQLEALVRSLDDWNKTFDKEELKKLVK